MSEKQKDTNPVEIIAVIMFIIAVLWFISMMAQTPPFPF